MYTAPTEAAGGIAPGHGSTAVVSATVDGFTVGYWWAAGAFWAGAVICGALIRGGTRFQQEAGQPKPLDEISGPF